MLKLGLIMVIVGAALGLVAQHLDTGPVDSRMAMIVPGLLAWRSARLARSSSP
jgi:hypothetical protein